MTGRSNVGKSTLLNALCRSKVARTSAAPGKTRLANIYRLAVEGGGPGKWGLYLVDLPGYGYAQGRGGCGGRVESGGGGVFSRGSGLGARGSDAPDQRAGARLRDAEPRGPNVREIPTRFTPGRQPPPGIGGGHSGGALAGRDGRGLPRRRDEDRQTVAHRARAQHEGARTYFRQTAAAGVGSGRRRNGYTVENDRQPGQNRSRMNGQSGRGGGGRAAAVDRNDRHDAAGPRRTAVNAATGVSDPPTWSAPSPPTVREQPRPPRQTRRRRARAAGRRSSSSARSRT